MASIFYDNGDDDEAEDDYETEDGDEAKDDDEAKGDDDEQQTMVCQVQAATDVCNNGVLMYVGNLEITKSKCCSILPRTRKCD